MIPHLLQKLTAVLAFNILFVISIIGQNEITDSYTIRYNENNPKLIRVEAKISVTDSILSMSNYGPVPENWPKYVKNLVATDTNGKNVGLEFTQENQWIINRIPGIRQLHLSYEVHVDHEDILWPGGIDGVAFVRPWGVMTSGRSLFVVNGSGKKNIMVELKLPQSWKISVPWKAAVAGSNVFKVSNTLQLQESLIFAGTHEEILIPNGDFNLKFVLGGTEIQDDKEAYIDRARKVLKYYIDLMGGNPVPAPGNDLSTVMVLINESEQVDGEVIGNHLSMFLNPKADMQNKTFGWFMFAHEFFHLWNGKTLRFRGTSSDWFKEGVTSYYTLKALQQVEAVNEDISKMIMNALFYNRYINDTGYGTISPADAASGFDKDNHWGLVYGGGFFAGVCMDLDIRNGNQNNLSLDDVMRALYKDFGGSDQYIDNNVLKTYIQNISHTDISGLMNSCITGLEPVPLSNYFKYAGVEAQVQDGQLILTHEAGKSELETEIWEGFLGARK